MIAGLPRAIRPALWLAAGWFLASLGPLLFIYSDSGSSLIELFKSLSGYQLESEQAGYLIVVLFAGLLSGAAIGIVLQRYSLRLTRRQPLALVGAWALAFLFTSFFAYPFGGGELIVFSWFLAGVLGGWATYAVLRRTDARFDRKALVVIILGWAIGLALGEWLIQFYDQEPLHSWLHAVFGDFTDAGGRSLFLSLGHAVEGLIGGLATFAVWFSLEKAKD